MQKEPVFAKVSVTIDRQQISQQALKFEPEIFEDQNPTHEEIVEVCANLGLIDESEIDFTSARLIGEEAYLKYCEEQYE